MANKVTLTKEVDTSIKPLPKKKLTLKNMNDISALTEHQKEFFKYFDDGASNIFLVGAAGCGKSFLALQRALDQVLDKTTPYDKVIVLRSAVAGRDVGFLTGSLEEKIEIFSAPYKQICSQLFGKADAWDILVAQGSIEFMSTSYLRGLTFDHAIIFVDEIQNMNFSSELETTMTRAGEYSRFIWAGDIAQCDLNKKKNDVSGWEEFIRINKYIDESKFVEFTIEDIVRSGLVKKYLEAKYKYS